MLVIENFFFICFSFKACLQDRRGVKYNVSFDLSASCVENFLLHSSNISRTMKLGRIDSVSPNGISSSIHDDDDDESSTISFHVSTKYSYTLTFSSTITAGRGKDLFFFIQRRTFLFSLHDVQLMEIKFPCRMANVFN